MTGNSRTNKRPTAIDLFAGCGGLTAGLKQAGFDVVGALEIDGLAADTYRLNHPEVNLKQIDIRKLEPTDWMDELGLEPGELTLLAGCPPCQGFSTLRTRNGASSNRDRRNALIMEMLHLLKVFQPRALMMENVPGLEDKDVFHRFRRGIEALGYDPGWRISDVSDFGVPQRRRRLVLVAGRGFTIPFARPAKRKATVREAIGDLKKAGRSGDELHDLPEKRNEKVKRIIACIPKDGGSRTALPSDLQLDCHDRCNGFKDVYGRMAWDAVAPTITSGCFNPSKGRFLHPEENRNITMREAALLQSFPENYRFDTKAGKQAIALMIGNALPPAFVRRQGMAIRRSTG